jgi:hypothetical protein
MLFKRVRLTSAVLLTAALYMTLCASSCPASSTIGKVAGEVQDTIANDAIPIFRANGISTVKLEEARDIAGKVKSAFDGGDAVNGVEWAGKLVDAFELIVIDANSIQNPTTRTIVLVAMVGVRHALKALADKIAAQAPAVAASGGMRSARPAQSIESLRAKPEWRCRNSVTGRFEKMQVCKDHPDQAQVETH